MVLNFHELRKVRTLFILGAGFINSFLQGAALARGPGYAPIVRDRRICFTSNARKQQILRFHPATAKAPLQGPGCAQDDTSENSFSAAC